MESVRVVVKFRGAEAGDMAAWKLAGETAELEGKEHKFAFDKVIGPVGSQEELYDVSSRQLVESLYLPLSLEGFNATIFAFGQSVLSTQGSGKTFSMLGPEEVTAALVNHTETNPSLTPLSGVIPRATFHIFDLVALGARQSTQYSIKCSYIEIYNESINDLLCNPPAENLRLREFPNLGMCVIGMTEKFISTPEEIFECLSLGTANRITCATGQNSRSSRSHTVFILLIEQKLLDGSTKLSKLNLVDLAGSEKVSKTGATGLALKEAQKINLSLTTLGRCIKALTARKEEHIPFRESKLTQILKESLGGNAKTALICTASQRAVHKEESYQTLKFAERAKLIKTKAKSNVIRSAEELQSLVNQLSEEIASLRAQKIDPTVSGTAEEHFELMQLKLQYNSLHESTQREIEQLRAQIDRMEKRSDLASVNSEIQSYIREIENCKIQSSSLRLELQQSQAKTEALEEESRRVSSQTDTQKARQKIAKLLWDLQVRECHELHWEYKCKQLECLFAIGLMHGNQTGLVPAKDFLDVSLRMQSAEENVQQLQIENEKLRVECETLKRDLSHEGNMNDTLNSEVGELVSQLQELSLKYETEEQLAETQKSIVFKLQEDNCRKEDTIGQLRNEIHRLGGSAEQPTVVNSDATIIKLRREVAETRNQLATVQAELQAYKRLLETTTRDSDRKTAEATQSLQLEKESNAALRTNLALAELEIARLKSASDRPSIAPSEQLQQALTAAQFEITSLNQQHDEEISSLRSNLIAVSTELASARKQISESQLRQDQQRFDLDRTRLQAEVNQLQRALAKEQETKAENAKKATTPAGIWKPIVVSPPEAQKPVKFGEWKLKRTESKFLKNAIEEAKRAEEQAPDSVYKVQYCAAQIKALYAAEDELPTRVSESSDWSSSEEDES